MFICERFQHIKPLVPLCSIHNLSRLILILRKSLFSWHKFICAVLFFSSGLSGNWIEIAYGTSSGTVRVIVQHPETVGHGPQLFQTFMVHRNPVVKVMLSEKNLVSICSEYNHVRTWNVTRFRGMISTQPGSTPLASFNVVSLEAQDAHPSSSVGSVIGEWSDI